MEQRSQNIVGWVAVGLSTFVSCFWAFWGIIENFHEGWYYASLFMNLGMMFAQYLAPMFLFIGVALVSIRWPRIGGALHLSFVVVAIWFLRGASWMLIALLIGGPLTILAACYIWGRPRPRRLAAAIVVGLPMLTLIVCGVEPAVRVATRLDDGNLGARHIQTAGVSLIWAPEGPGWPRDGVPWDEAVRRARYLNEDGTALADTPQDIWHLPTVDEAVSSQCRGGKPCGGQWDASQEKASYARKPDKESPLWDVHSKVIYWWTATEVDPRKAYIIVYNGQIHPRSKNARWGYLGFRAVKPSRNEISAQFRGGLVERANWAACGESDGLDRALRSVSTRVPFARAPFLPPRTPQSEATW